MADGPGPNKYFSKKKISCLIYLFQFYTTPKITQKQGGLNFSLSKPSPSLSPRPDNLIVLVFFTFAFHQLDRPSVNVRSKVRKQKQSSNDVRNRKPSRIVQLKIDLCFKHSSPPKHETRRFCFMSEKNH